jgi:hypothetical protein
VRWHLVLSTVKGWSWSPPSDDIIMYNRTGILNKKQHTCVSVHDEIYTRFLFRTPDKLYLFIHRCRLFTHRGLSMCSTCPSCCTGLSADCVTRVPLGLRGPLCGEMIPECIQAETTTTPTMLDRAMIPECIQAETTRPPTMQGGGWLHTNRPIITRRAKLGECVVNSC